MSRSEYADEADNIGLWSRLKERIGLNEYEEEDYEEDDDSPEPLRRRGTFLRLHAPRLNEISVRLNVTSMEDAKEAADRIKARQSVILNLEQTDEATATRVVDFISGVTYALDGYYQKVGEKVFLFTPENTVISVEEQPAPRSGRFYNRRDD